MQFAKQVTRGICLVALVVAGYISMPDEAEAQHTDLPVARGPAVLLNPRQAWQP